MSTKTLAVALALVASAPALAVAGGMTLHTRGVRATARGGALVAGADDLDALWMNPGGLAHLAGGKHKTALLVDAAFVSQAGDYTRIDSGGNTLASVSNQSPGLPIPSLVAGFDLGEDGVLAAGVYAPYAGLMKFADDGPQRYSLGDMSKTLIVTVAVGVGWRIGDHVRIGATVQDWVSSLGQTMTVSGCPGETVCAPEDPDWDALVQVDQNDLFNPSGSVGIQADAGDKITVGASFQVPILFAGSATLRTRLPRSGFYDGATVVGDKANVRFWFPGVARLGIEVRPTPRWRIEAAGDLELWSMHEEMAITPIDMRIEGAPGVGTYYLGPMTVPRHYKNTVAASLGIEGQPAAGTPLRVLAGYTYETAAAPDAYLSVLTFDGAKHLASLGLGYSFGSYTLDAAVAFAKVADRTVTPAVGLSPQLNPVRDPNDPPLTTYVNWGDYKTSWFVAGLSLRAAI